MQQHPQPIDHRVAPRARVQQQQATLDAKSQLAQYQASKTTPIDFIIEGVNPQELTGGREYSFAIQLDAKEFHPYVDARVISIIAEVDGIDVHERPGRGREQDLTTVPGIADIMPRFGGTGRTWTRLDSERVVKSSCSQSCR